ncbi:MAG TPA: hypothetical protein VNJ08_09270 [Bacteriovoracaceae bacterium]|nr:hypothetical protein [Bacteriovoracaceae bacterium]
MKKTAWFLPFLVALPLQAQSLLGTLNQYQSALEPDSTSPGSANPIIKKPGQEVSSTSESSAVGSGKCEENDQTSLPLSYVTSLLQAKNGHLDVSYDPRKGSLQISAPDMISNCNSMVEWKLKEQEITGSKVYAIELKIKSSGECSDAGCEYKVAKVEGGAFKEWQKLTLKPTLKGFEECLQKSGVIDGGKVKASAIYSAPLMEKFTDIKDSGKVLFVSHGPSSAQVKAKYGKFDTIDKCDHYEAINPDMKKILSLKDEDRERLDAEALKLKGCSINEYHKVSDFIEKYEDYATQLGSLRDNLILEAAKKSAKAMDEGKYTEDDLKVMADFDKYIVQPKVEKARQLYLELRALEGTPDSAQKKEALRALLVELKTYNAKPYFQAVHTKKLISDGRFEEAEKLNTMKVSLDMYSKLGSKTGSVVLTPEVLDSRVHGSRQKFHNDLEQEKETYAIRTGEVTGKEDHFKHMASDMRANIQRRTANFTAEIQDEMGRMRQGGYCYQYFRNTQKCIQDSMERAQELQALLKHYNQVDTERAAEYDAKAAGFGKLEAEGRRYLATQNGDEVPEEKPASAVPPKPVDTTLPERRSSNGAYTFDYNPQQQQQQGGQQGMQQPQQQQQNPWAGMFGQQQNPYQPYGQQQPGGFLGWGGQQQQQPFMGQQAYNGFGMQPGYGGYGGAGGGYSFQWPGAGQQQQPMGMGGYGQQPMGMGGYGQQQQPGGFWGQPYPAYNMYSMYGR